MLEKYRWLVETGKGRTPEAISLKEQLLIADPTNARLIPYQVAIIDFESACYDPDEDQSAEQTAAPLVAYCKKFGDKDKANLWRLQMIIAQVFYEQDMLPEALQYAEAALQTSPTTVQPEIMTAIKSIQTELINYEIETNKKQRKIDTKTQRKEHTKLITTPSL